MGAQRTGQAREKPFSSLLEAVTGARIIGDGAVRITGLAYDSRRVAPGDAFICVPGERADGHDFVPQAVARGAVALVVASGRERGLQPPAGGAIGVVENTRQAMAQLARCFYDDPSSRLTLAGVTGTNGKTTTALMLDSIFRAAGRQSGVIGTIEYRIGGQRRRAVHTTPEAVDLQLLLAELLEAGATHAAMEVSSHALALHRVDGCRFAAAVFTNLTPEHLDFHRNMREYLAAKIKLFEEEQFLPRVGERVNAVNLDDPTGPEVVRRARGRTLTYGLEAPADCRAERVELSAEETRFHLALPDGRVSVAMRLVGRFNVSNALAAAAAAAGLGFSPEQIRAGLEGMEPVRGRFERVPSASRNIVVDYAHTPDALARALATARELSPSRVIVVFGCGGDRDPTKRPVMGELASRLAERCIITSDNPRREPPEAIIAQIVAGIPAEARARCLVEPDRARAIRLAVAEAGPQDLVLIAGKGHEDYQIIGQQRLHFDDREQAEAALRELEGATSA